MTEAAGSGGNNLDFIRLVAALTVLVSHAFVLTGHPGDEPFAALFSHSIDGGALAVGVFFVISGYLIARSAQRRPPWAFVRARLRRILPGYVTVIVFQAFLLGPLLTSLPLAAYLADGGLWWGLMRALLFSPVPGLPGVFQGNPLPGLVNASLWTLRIEVLCYAMTLGLGWAGLLQSRRILLPLGCAWLALAMTVAARAGYAPPWLAELRTTAILDCVLHYLMGTALYTWRDTIRPGPALAGVAAAMLLILVPTPLAPVAWHVALPSIVMGLALSRPITAPLMAAVGDVSYGAYLYAFPVSQTLLAFMPLHPLPLIAASLPPTLLCAALSRRFVELPFLRGKRDRTGRSE